MASTAFEQRPRVQRRQAVDDGGAARLELRALGVGREQVERRAAHQLRDERPRLAGRADPLVERELVERRALDQIREGEQPLGGQRSLEDDAVQIGDEAAARVHAAVADGVRQQLREQLADAAAVVGVQRLPSR